MESNNLWLLEIIIVVCLLNGAQIIVGEKSHHQLYHRRDLTRPKVEKKLEITETKVISEAERETQMLIKLLKLPRAYNRFEHPVLFDTGNFSRIPISVGIQVQNIRGIDGLSEEITMEIDLVTKWIDFAIRDYHMNSDNVYRYLDSGFLKEIWWPNLFFNRTALVIRPDLHGSTYIPKPVKLSINPKIGAVEMSSRLVLKLYCPMDFKYYPADTQKCDVELQSYADSSVDITLKWHTNASGIPQVFLVNRGHPNFDIHIHDIVTKTHIDRGIGIPKAEHTVLQFSLSTRRKLSFHIMQTFAPSVFLVVITWLAFFIPMELLEARIGISMTILLTLTAMFASIKEYTPQVSYVKAIDTWMLVCIVFVFLTLFQFTFLMYLRHLNDKAHGKAIEATMNKVDHPDVEEYGSQMKLLALQRRDKSVEEYLRVEKLYRITTKAVETYGFVILSFGFLIFNLSYWPWLIKSANYGDFTVNLHHNSQ